MTVFLKISVLQKCREKNATCTLDKTVLFSYVAQDIHTKVHYPEADPGY